MQHKKNYNIFPGYSIQNQFWKKHGIIISMLSHAPNIHNPHENLFSNTATSLPIPQFFAFITQCLNPRRNLASSVFILNIICPKSWLVRNYCPTQSLCVPKFDALSNLIIEVVMPLICSPYWCYLINFLCVLSNAQTVSHIIPLKVTFFGWCYYCK